MDYMEQRAIKAIGSLVKIAYEFAHNDNLSHEQKELLFDFWREFDDLRQYAEQLDV